MPTLTVRIRCVGFDEPARRLFRDQVDAFLAPRPAEMFALLADAVGHPWPATLDLVFMLEDPDHPSSVLEPDWARRFPSNSWNEGLRTLERLLIQALLAVRPTDDHPRLLAAAHAAACHVIHRTVDITHVCAMRLGEGVPAPPLPRTVPVGNVAKAGRMLLVSIAPNAHDTSIAIADAENVLLVLEAERPTRIKRKWCDARELEDLVALGLACLGRSVDEVSHWVGTAMLNTLLHPSERWCGWTNCVSASIFGQPRSFFCVNHHLAHASMFFASPFQEAVIDACDGGGDRRNYATFRGYQNGSGQATIEPFESRSGTRFSGVFYDVVSYYVYKRYCQEGKLMGLSAHGNHREDMYAFLHDHASLLSTQPHERSYALLQSRFPLDGGAWRDPVAVDLAYNAQRVFERKRVEQIAGIAHGSRNLVLTGGAALNIHANTEIASRWPDHGLYIPPCCDDTGQALGALLYYTHAVLGMPIRVDLPFIGMGAEDENPISDGVIERAVDDLVAGRVVAWHWGRSEIGPRALGHRSLLCAPFTVDHRRLVSERVKRREPYRPVAPVILEERMNEWFDLPFPSPYMLFAAQGTERARQEAPAVIHHDGSARIQSISVHSSDPLAHLIACFEARTGIPILINTSLNGPGEPIASSPEDTLRFAAQHEKVIAYTNGTRYPDD